MLEDRYYQICKQNYPIRILVHATYEAKQTLAAKGITPAIFLSPFYMKKGDYSMEVAYGPVKQKNYKPLAQICPIDYDQYQNKNLDQTTNQIIRQTVADSQCKNPKNITSQTFKNRSSIQNYLNNINFHWFQNGIRNFYHSLSLNQSNFKKQTLSQPKGLAFLIEVNDKTLKENFEKIKKQADQLIKRMYYLNPSQTKSLPILAVIFFDPNKKYSYKDVKLYSDSLKSQYNIETVLTAKVEINGPGTLDSFSWSNYTRPIFNFNYKMTPSDPIKFLNEQGTKCLADTVNIHKQRIKKNIQARIQTLWKKHDDHYSMGNKLIGFFTKSNSAPKQKFFVTEEAEGRQLADLMFMLEDFKKAHDVYKNILKDFEKREINLQMDLKYIMSVCYQMGKFVGQKVNSTTPKQFLQKQAEMFQIYQKLGRKQLTKFLVLFLYQLHTFRIFDSNLIKDKFLLYIKRAMNMSDQKRPDEHKQPTKYHFLMPTLLYEQYSNLNLLYGFIDYRRYCYDTVRVSMKYAEYRLFSHALRCLMIVEGIYVGTVSAMEKYIAVHLSSDYVQNKHFQQSLNSIKKAWKILAQSTTFQDYYLESENIEFKKMLANHGKIINQIQKFSPQILSIPDDKSLTIPHVIQTDLKLSGQEQIQQVDRTGISWTQISQYFNQNTQLYSEGYNKATMQKIFKLYDCSQSEQKQLIYRIKCQNSSDFVISKNARISYVKQPIKFSLTFQNPFVQQILISDFKVLIKDTYKNYEIVHNPSNEFISILPHKKVDITFQIIPNETGLIQFQGLQWTFFKMRTKYTIKDIRNLESPVKPFYFIIKIVQPKGKLKVHENSEQQLYEGETYQSKVVLQNCGSKPIQSVYIAFGCDKFYGKKYQRLNINLQPLQKKEIQFSLNLPAVPSNIQKDWKLMDKKIFLYKTDGQFRVHRSSILTLINKILYQQLKCQKLSTHLHLLTVIQNKTNQKQTIIQNLIIKQGFQVSKTDRTQFQNTQTYFFFLLKNPNALCEIFNFQTQSLQSNNNIFKPKIDKLKLISTDKNQDRIELIFGWKNLSGKRKGFIQVSPLQIKPLRQQVLPFSFYTTMPFTLKNNFQNNPVLQHNFDIKIKNIFYHKQVVIKIQMVQDNLNGVYWQGICEQNFTLSADQQVSFDVTIIVSKPGVYDISNCLKYTLELDKQSITIRHSEHEKVMLHVIEELGKQLQNKSDIMKKLNTRFSESIDLGQNSLMKRKSQDQTAQIMLFGQQDVKLISSPRNSQPSPFSNLIQNQLLGNRQQKQTLLGKSQQFGKNFQQSLKSQTQTQSKSEQNDFVDLL